MQRRQFATIMGLSLAPSLHITVVKAHQTELPMKQQVLGEIVRATIQLIMIAGAGGAISYWYRKLGDKENRQEAIRVAIRDLIKQVDELYRNSKQVKRIIRSRKRNEDGRWLVDKEAFEERMEELSRIQLALEQSRQIVRTRTDLFSDDRQDRIVDFLKYSECYLQFVVEEFEKRRAIEIGNSYEISESCCMLRDFLDRRQIPEAIEEDFREMEDGCTVASRYAAFRRIRATTREINRLNGLPEKQGHKPVADECMLLAVRDMREAMLPAEIASTSLRRRIPSWFFGTTAPSQRAVTFPKSAS